MITNVEKQRWIKEGKKKKARAILIVCDTFSYEDYPVYVSKNENVSTVRARYDGVNMQRVQEVVML